jgi:hypothetical protein
MGFVEFYFSMRNEEAVARVKLCDIQAEYGQQLKQINFPIAGIE